MQSQGEYNHTAFLSHSSDDRDFVLDHIYPKLEEGLASVLKVDDRCVGVGDLDMVPGHRIDDEIIKVVEKSSLMIFFVSKSFCKQYWCKFEFEAAVHSGKPLILMMYGKVSRRRMPPVLRNRFDSYTRAHLTIQDGVPVITPDWDFLCSSIIRLVGEQPDPEPDDDSESEDDNDEKGNSDLEGGTDVVADTASSSRDDQTNCNNIAQAEGNSDAVFADPVTDAADKCGRSGDFTTVNTGYGMPNGGIDKEICGETIHVVVDVHVTANGEKYDRAGEIEAAKFKRKNNIHKCVKVNGLMSDSGKGIEIDRYDGCKKIEVDIFDSGKEIEVDRFNSGREIDFDRYDSGKEIEDDRYDSGKEIEVDMRDSGKEIEIDRCDSGKEIEVDRRDSDKEIEVDMRDSGKEIEIDRCDSGKEIEIDRCDSGKETEIDRCDRGKEIDIDRYDSGKEIEVDRYDSGKEIDNDRYESDIDIGVASSDVSSALSSKGCENYCSKKIEGGKHIAPCHECKKLSDDAQVTSNTENSASMCNNDIINHTTVVNHVKPGSSVDDNIVVIGSVEVENVEQDVRSNDLEDDKNPLIQNMKPNCCIM